VNLIFVLIIYDFLKERKKENFDLGSGIRQPLFQLLPPAIFFFFNISLFFFLETTKTNALINICFSFILNTST
jgi:hypothetical protein